MKGVAVILFITSILAGCSGQPHTLVGAGEGEGSNAARAKTLDDLKHLMDTNEDRRQFHQDLESIRDWTGDGPGK